MVYACTDANGGPFICVGGGGFWSAFVLLRFLTSEHELSLFASALLLFRFSAFLPVFAFRFLLVFASAVAFLLLCSSASLFCFSACPLLCFNALLSCFSALHLFVFCLLFLMLWLFFTLILVLLVPL